ncbi:MAG: NAD(P)/FAD-dependent oxidoreductase [Bacteroidales bacterium]|jgi:uncharacterized FAD-dependent dehydrogenase|nr:NAD(P)/FAD-dependent oxidoreductase [Bacteroidales bacterium]
MIKELEITIPPVDFANVEDVRNEIAKAARIDSKAYPYYRILRRSIDARKQPCYHLRVEVSDKPFVFSPKFPPNYKDVSQGRPVIIVGAGPAGLFAALTLIENGLKPVIIEKGQAIEQRKVDISRIIRTKTINPNSNWCFGEGGAGTFSDGKLFTRSSKRGNMIKVLETFVLHGANESILYDSHPHIGTDNLSRIIKSIRKTIEKYGGEYHFGKTLKDIIIRNNQAVGIITEDGETISSHAIILATGNSSRDIYELFYHKGLFMEAKPFAIGVRIEHLQSHINEIQYRSNSYDTLLPPASYQLAFTDTKGGVFSFCMCPGGIIIPASTAENESVVNGMSNSSRNSPFANSGIVVAINNVNSNPLSLLEFQKKCERKAFAGNISAFGQRVCDFLENKPSTVLPKSSYLGDLKATNLNGILPDFICERLKIGLLHFETKMKGFITEAANLIAIESRTSSPVRLTRNEKTLEHIQITGLYPCGEGAGYAGGITSSAIEGINTALAIASIR